MSVRNVIEEGSKVIIKRDTFLRFEVVSQKRRVDIQRRHIYLGNAIGCPYGSTFEVKEKQLYLKTPSDSTVDQSNHLTTSGENNQFINDDGCSQKMSKEKIMALKAEGIAGEKIIHQLIENSETFVKKTEFSQEKYLKKKKKRHIEEVTILRPTLPLICELLYTNSPEKIMNLRMDTVSQILTMANVQSNTNVMIVESTQSFLASIILHRMGGLGNLIQLYNGDFPVRLCLPCFELEPKDLKILNGFPMNNINTLKKTCLTDKGVHESTKSDVPSTSHTSCCNETDRAESVDEAKLGPCENENINTKTNHKALTEEEKLARKKNRDDEEERACGLLNTTLMDSLIIASKFHPKPTLLRLYEFLAPSRPFVVYSPSREVLVECYTALKQLRNAILLNLSETWWRSYQVLPQRTHPHIMMDGCSGYLLTGIKVDPSEQEQGLVESPTKKLKTA